MPEVRTASRALWLLSVTCHDVVVVSETRLRLPQLLFSTPPLLLQHGDYLCFAKGGVSLWYHTWLSRCKMATANDLPPRGECNQQQVPQGLLPSHQLLEQPSSELRTQRTHNTTILWPYSVTPFLANENTRQSRLTRLIEVHQERTLSKRNRLSRYPRLFHLL